MRKLILTANKQDAIQNNQTSQNQAIIFNTLTNENEKTPTPKTKATNIKSQKPEKRESRRDRLGNGYEKVSKIVGSGEDKIPSFGIYRRAFEIGRFIFGYMIKGHKSEEELVRNSFFFIF